MVMRIGPVGESGAAPPAAVAGPLDAAIEALAARLRAGGDIAAPVRAASVAVAGAARLLHAASDAVPAAMPPDAVARRALTRTALRTAVAAWPGVRSACEAASRPQGPLWPLAPDPHGAAARTAAAADALLFRLHRATVVAQDSQAAAAGLFADIALPHGVFMACVQAARRVVLARQGERDDSFLDVGCGAGMKMIAATPFFTRVAGVEYDPGHAAAARALLDRAGMQDAVVERADGRTFGSYRDHDVVYFFRPMRDEAMLAELERAIVAGVRRHTVLIAPYAAFARRGPALGCPALAGHLYLAHATPGEAAELAGRAGTVGHAGKTPGRRGHPWRAVLEALADRGHAPPDEPPATA
jgi:SAM-dependent methyltransferase